MNTTIEKNLKIYLENLKKDIDTKESWSMAEIRRFLQQHTTSIKNDSKVFILIQENDKYCRYASDFKAYSWRGSYSLPASILDQEIYIVKDIIKNLQENDGKVVESYKGGEHILNENDLLFFTIDISSSGNLTTIVDMVVIDNIVFCITNNDMY